MDNSPSHHFQNSFQNSFQGKHILITGGTKGLGLRTACLLASQGANLYLSYRSDAAGAKKALELVRSHGVGCEILSCDQVEDGAADRLFDWVERHVPQLDAYIHNAAATAFKNLLEISPQNVDKTMNITVKSFIRGVQRAVPLMKAGSSIVTISGMDTLRAVPRHGLLGAAKSALETLTAYWAHELAPRKIRVNGVNPGFFDSDSTRKYLGPAFAPLNALFAQSTPGKEGASLDDIAKVIAFLCSADSHWIVGQTLIVDGGFHFSMANLQL